MTRRGARQRTAMVDGRLVARIARHELTPPLTLQRDLLRAAEEAGEHHPALRLARANAEEMLGVLDLLAGLAERDVTGPRLPLARVMGQALQVAPAASVHLSRPAALAPVDGFRTTSVLTNLLDNARRHRDDPSVAVLGCVRHTCVRLRLVHPGACPSEVRAALRARQPPQGRRGLGLWLVTRLVADMAGTVRVHTSGGVAGWEIRIGIPLGL